MGGLEQALVGGVGGGEGWTKGWGVERGVLD